MSKNPAIKGLLAIAVLCGSVAPVKAQQANVAQVLGIKPKIDDVNFTTPAPAEIAKCTLEVIKGPTGGSGYLLSDDQKRPLRKFLDSAGTNRVDTWSFYQDGAEVYRESVVGGVYSFRWMGAGGMKWGVGTVDKAGKGHVESWRMISADEAAQEAFQALATGDFERMKALFLTPQEIQALGLPAGESQKIVAAQQAAAAKFQKVRAGMPNLPTATFARLENAKPGAFPTDLTGGTQDIVKIPSGLILYENAAGAAKKHDFLNSSEIVQIGNAWRLTDIPNSDAGGPGGVGVNPQLAGLLNQLMLIDAAMPAPGTGKLGAWTIQRVPVVQKIAEIVKAEEQENWYKQIFDNLAAAIVDRDETLVPVMAKWKTHFATNAPGSSLAAYGTYREIYSTYQSKVAKAPNSALAKLQVAYHEDLAKFIQTFPKADDTPDALIQIATNADFSGNDDEAKKLYGQIVANFPNSNNASKAAGAIRRIDSVGQPFVLTGPTLENREFKHSPGKITVVYYWASYSNQAIGEFATLKKLQQIFGKDLDIISVNLDDKAADAAAFLQRTPLNAPHLHQPGKDGGMSGPLATNYGIFGLPHIFLIDAGGRVVSSKIQINALEDEITKLTKK